MARWRVWMLMLVATVGLMACGGGGGSEQAPPTLNPPPPVVPPPAPPPSGPTSTQLVLDSEAGDPIAQGRRHAYSQSDAAFDVRHSNGTLSVRVEGDQHWVAAFRPGTESRLRVGRYEGARNRFDAPAGTPAMHWSGEGRWCRNSTGWFAIDQLDEGGVPGGLVSITLRFEVFCDGATAALRGEVRYLSTDTTRPPAVPTSAPPALWRPSAAGLPATGNLLHIESEAGDPLGLGRSTTWASGAARIRGTDYGGQFHLHVSGPRRSAISALRNVDGSSRMLEGYYPDLALHGIHNPVRGGLSWVIDGRGCSASRGWAMVDRVEYRGSELVAIEYRFEQRCAGASGALRGLVRWSREDERPEPVATVPTAAGSWWPADAALPATGNLFHFESDRGHAIGLGQRRSYTPLDAVFSVTETSGELHLQVRSEMPLTLRFRPAATTTPLQTGVHADLSQWSSPDQPRYLTLDVAGNGCQGLSWLAVDEVERVEGRLVALSLRFENRCAAFPGGLRGLVRWRAADTRVPPPPSTVPATFWRPAAPPTDATRTWVVVDSMRNSRVGMGASGVYTPVDARIRFEGRDNRLELHVEGHEKWTLQFRAPEGFDRIVPGHYANLNALHVGNPAAGGLLLYGRARSSTHAQGSCGGLVGSVAIDDIEYASDGRIVAVRLRVEQRCDPVAWGAAWLELNWREADDRLPPGPARAPPGLWQPPAGALPASGNVLYFESPQGDPVGGGQTRLLSGATVSFDLNDLLLDRLIVLTVREPAIPMAQWSLMLQPMFSRPRLETGLYPMLADENGANPARGALRFSSLNACEHAAGWFVIDEVAYDGDRLTLLRGRFEQDCHLLGLTVVRQHGAFRWARPG